MDGPDDTDSLAEEPAVTTRSPSITTTTSTPATSLKVKGNPSSKKERGTAMPPATAMHKVKPMSAEDSTLLASLPADLAEHGATSTHISSQNVSDELSKQKDESRRGGEESEHNLSTVAGVLTRHAKMEKAEDAAALLPEKPRRDGDGDTAESRLEESEELLGDVHFYEARSSRSRSHSTAPQTLTIPYPASASALSAFGAKQEDNEAWEAVARTAIDAQERQLCHTLLSIFPPELLRDAESERCLAKARDPGSGTEAMDIKSTSSTPSQPVSSGPALSPFPSPFLSPEPLLPLLKALCEDKAYVHGAWCRYEDDLAVRRIQSSIQRKRQRHSFNKGGRKASPSGPTAAAQRRNGDADGGDESSADEDKTAEEDELQPPEAHWVEVPPAFTGGPLPLPTTATHPAPVSSVTGGFQWTPWRFYREKRRRSARRPTECSACPAEARSSAVAGAVRPGLFSATPSNTALSSAGVPSPACSEVPSLPVLQVEVDVPKSAAAVVAPMTPQERKGYARYVMSSGKLRHDCRDPYTFLVSRAKEMRIQWKRQHPMN
ncbi:hypothetical protein, conserved [Leishmania lindenbergi]|uniref:Uncharacterized protein n=1 Tax=Leishmania lindenbergi TaxID=651832 RepID=A0AAW3AAT2_9TRYP